MAGVVLHAGQRGDQAGDARQCPQDGGIPVGKRTAQQFLLHLAELGGGELGLAPGPPGGLQSWFPLLLPGTVPPADGLAAHPQRAHHFCLGLAFPEQPPCLQSALLQHLEISCASGPCSHAHGIP